MLWFGLVDKHFDTTVEVGTYQHVAAAALLALLDERIRRMGDGDIIRRDLVVRLGLDDCLRVRSKDRTRHRRIVRLDTLPKVAAIPANRAQLGVIVVRLPDVDHLVLRARDDVLAVVRKRRLDLGRHVQVALVLAAEVQITQVVQPDAAVVGRDEDFVLPRHRFDSADLATDRVLAARRSHVDLRVILQLIGVVEQAASVVRSDHGKLAVLAEVRRRDELV